MDISPEDLIDPELNILDDIPANARIEVKIVMKSHHEPPNDFKTMENRLKLNNANVVVVAYAKEWTKSTVGFVCSTEW